MKVDKTETATEIQEVKGVKSKFPIFKNHFFFGEKKTENTACLLFYKTRSNMFLIMSDMHNKCIFSCTSGIAMVGRSKKNKVSSQNV